jgi:hypothetical protein
MKKTIIIILLVALFAFSGCTLLTKFDEVKQRYLSSRVDQLLTEMPTGITTVETEKDNGAESAEVTETSSVSAAIATAAAQATAQAEEVALTEAVTEEPKAEPTATPTSAPTPTPTIASNDPGIYLGAADWTDDMGTIKNWSLDSNDYSTTVQQDGYYRITSLAAADGWRLAQTDAITDGYIEAAFKTETCSGDDHYGIIFRVPGLQSADRGYLFGITCDGRYNVRVWDGTTGETGTMTTLISYKASEMINVGSNAENVLGVMMSGNVITLYINGELVDLVIDDTFTSGYFGVFAGWEQTEGFSVRLEKTSYWLIAEE